MKISFKGDYALKIILDLSVSNGQSITQIKDIAKRQDIPKKFLEQIVLQLKSAKYVDTVRGRNGGVMLAKEPSEISIGEIIRLIEGPTYPIACVTSAGYKKCGFASTCVFQGVWKEIDNRINEVVDRITFQDLAERQKKLERGAALDYAI